MTEKDSVIRLLVPSQLGGLGKDYDVFLDVDDIWK